MSEDPAELYVEQIERNAEDDTETISGLGFLTMLNNYGAILAWEFTEFDESDDEITVTTMAQLTV